MGCFGGCGGGYGYAAPVAGAVTVEEWVAVLL